MADIVSKTINTQIRKKLSDGTYQVEHPETEIGNVLGKATKAEAVAGTSNIKYMTPLRVKEAIDSRIIKGSFLGDGEDLRFINIGITPSYVKVIGNTSTTNSAVTEITMIEGMSVSHHPAYTGMAHTSRRGTPSIVSNGFNVNGSSNARGVTYYYIAIL